MVEIPHLKQGLVMQVTITKEQYLKIRKPLPVRHVAVRYNEPGISEYSKTQARRANTLQRIVAKGK